ncbi:MAG: sulfatase [Acidobacteriota bacterium]|nr:MAG: sulfatase [Acidobacteriota bacterium]
MNTVKRALFLTTLLLWAACGFDTGTRRSEERPNVLIAISDDQSWPHASAYGSGWLETPHFDRIAREGIRFENAFTTSPGCAPSRASIVLGRFPWQNEHAGNHNSLWPAKYRPLPDLLAETGYLVGYTGKGVGPFHWALAGRYQNPAGSEYNGARLEPPFQYISDIDYATNFQQFLSERDDSQPFFFWYGATEPHRRYDIGAGERSGKSLDSVNVPSFLPDSEEVRGDLLDYAVEIEWFDKHLGRILEILEASGELDNTLIIVTSDNGMPFPAAKANCYEYGTHVPLAIRWGREVTKPHVENALISLADLMPTILDATSVPYPTEFPVSAQSFIGLLRGDSNLPVREEVFFSRERHSSSRWSNLGYPQRSIRTQDYLYIRNFTPERWPAGAPVRLAEDGALNPGFHDLDWGPDSGRSSGFLVKHRDNEPMRPLFDHALGKRPGEQLFDVVKDPECLNNLAEDPRFAGIRASLSAKLEAFLRETGDARIVGPDPDIFESYPRYAGIRTFPEPDWVREIDPARLAQLVSRVDSDHSPIRPPAKIGDWGLEAGPWRLEKESDGSWNLTPADGSSQNDLNRQMPRLKSQLIRLFEWFSEADTG